MSRTIDERIVSMEFDNQRFEQNVRTSLSTLDKLKQSLNLTGAAKGFEHINAAAKSCNLAPLSNAAEAVKMKFSAMEVMAVTTLANITNSAVNAGKRIAQALTIDPIKTGFQEYELKMGSIQTIMASTGESLATVNDYLNELNEYSDETIYSFSDMTQNIGKFTNAGVKLEDAVAAIKGISNEAALSGANANEASRAMYNFAQALSAGYVKLIDWKSIELANMATVDFKNQLIETAVAMGTITEAGDGMYKTVSGELFNATKNFNETLQDEWMTTEVLVQTLGMYADETTEIGKRATQAATEVKTFSMMLDALKESAQSGWAQTWELLFGNFTEGKNLWTSINNVVGGMLDSSSDSRNRFLKRVLHNSGYDEIINRIEEAGIAAGDFEEALKGVLTENGYAVDKMIEKHGTLEQAFVSGAVSSKWLQVAIDELNGSIAAFDPSIFTRELKKGLTGDDVAEMQQLLSDLGYDFSRFGVDGIFGSETQAAVKAFQEAMGLEVTGIFDEATVKELEKATTKTSELKVEIQDLLDGVKKLGGRELLVSAFGNLWKAISKPLAAIKNAFTSTFSLKPETLYNIIDGFHKFTEMLVMDDKNVEKLGAGFKGLFAIFEVGTSIVGGGLKLAFRGLMYVLDHFDLSILDVVENAGKALTTFRNWVFENGILAKAFHKILDVLIMVGEGAYAFGKSLFESDAVQNFINRIKDLKGVLVDTFEKPYNKVKKFFGLIKDYLNGKEILGEGGVKKLISGKQIVTYFKEEVLGAFKKIDLEAIRSKIAEIFSGILSKITDTVKNIDFKGIFAKVKSWLAGFKNSVATNLGIVSEKFSGVKDAIVGFFTAIKEKIGDNWGKILALGSLILFIFFLKKIKDAVELLASPLDSFDDLCDNIGKAFKSLGTYFKSAAVKNIAISIGILAASLIGLSMVDQGKLWSAVGALSVMTILLGALVIVANKFGPKDAKAMTQSSLGILSIAGSILILALAAKMIAGMDGGQLAKAGLVILGFIGVLHLVSKTTKNIGKGAVALGKMMVQLSGALIIMAFAIKILGNMDLKELIQGGIAVTYFMGLIVGMMAATKLIGKDIHEFGKLMLQLSAALILLAIATKMLGKMELKTLIQGGLAVTYFLGLMTAMMYATKWMAKDVGQFAMTMLGLSGSLILIALAISMLGKMDLKTVLKGGIIATAILGVMTGVMATMQYITKNAKNAGKIGLMMLGFAGAILIMTGAILALSMVEGKDLAKATIAVGGIAAVFAGLLYISKFAKNIKMGTIIGLSIAVAILAASIVALSFVDTKKLASATVALGAIMGMLSLLAYTSSFVKAKSLVGLAGMALVIAGLGYILTSITNGIKDPDAAIKVATALSEVILALSGACALVAAAGKFGKKSLYGVGVLAGVVGIFGIIAGIAIWQLPNIGKQLSKFMDNLAPFLRGLKNVDPSMMDSLKTLGEAMWEFTKAGALFAVANALTFGGMGVAFSSFKDFIKEAVPIVKDIAIEVSDMDINIDNLNAIVGAIGTLAEAANNISSNKAIIVATKWGVGGGFSWSALGSFTEFVKEAIPVISDLATTVKSEKISASNIDVVKAICEAVGVLAEAADAAPDIEVGGAFTKFGGGAYVSVPNLSAFASFIEDVAPIMTDFAVDIDEAGIKKDDAENLIGICEAVSVLAQAADAAPGVEIAGAIASFAGGAGIGGYISAPDLQTFTSWIEDVIPIVSDFAVDIEEAGIKKDDAENLKGICEAVSVLAEAAGAAPGVDVAAGIAKFACGGGGGVYISIPDLESFTSWIQEVIPVITSFSTEIGESTISKDDTTKLKSICEAVGVLAEAAGAAPGTEIGGGLAAVGPLIAGGGYIKATDLTGFKDWISEVAPVMSGFALDVQAASLTESDSETLKSICSAVGILAEAAALAPKEETAVSPFGVYISTTDLTDFKDWIVSVVPVMQTVATEISTAMSDSTGATITEAGVNTLTNICNAARTLAEAARLAPKAETYSGIFGSWVSTTDLESTTEWFKGVIATMQDLGAALAESDTVMDLAKLQSLATAAKTLSETIMYATTAQNEGGYDGDTLTSHFQTVAIAMQTFAEEINKIEDINLDKIATVSTAAKNASSALLSLSNFDYTTVDVEAFSGKLDSLVTAVSDFSTDMSGVDASSATLQLTTLANTIGGLSFINFTGASSFETALDTLGKTGVEKFIKAFADAVPKVEKAANALVSTTAATLGSNDNYLKFTNAGKYVVTGFADGISINTFKAEAAAAAMAEAAYLAAKEELDVNSPSKIFRWLAGSVPEGFAMGIDDESDMVEKSSMNMAERALNGTKKVISRISDLINSDIDTQPTIRPVLDLSAVSAGAGAIDGMFDMSPRVGAMANIRAINTMMNNRQNGANDDVISAIKDLGKRIGSMGGDTYNFDGISYDDGTNIHNAVQTLVRAAKIERRK